MKRILILFALTALFASCKKQNPQPTPFQEKDLAGVWVCTRITEIYNGQSEDTYNPAASFAVDPVEKEIEFIYGNNSTVYSWSFANNQVTLTHKESAPLVCKLSVLDGKHVVMSTETEYQGLSFVYYATNLSAILPGEWTIPWPGRQYKVNFLAKNMNAGTSTWKTVEGAAAGEFNWHLYCSEEDPGRVDIFFSSDTLTWNDTLIVKEVRSDSSILVYSTDTHTEILMTKS